MLRRCSSSEIKLLPLCKKTDARGSWDPVLGAMLADQKSTEDGDASLSMLSSLGSLDRSDSGDTLDRDLKRQQHKQNMLTLLLQQQEQQASYRRNSSSLYLLLQQQQQHRLSTEQHSQQSYELPLQRLSSSSHTVDNAVCLTSTSTSTSSTMSAEAAAGVAAAATAAVAAKSMKPEAELITEETTPEADSSLRPFGSFSKNGETASPWLLRTVYSASSPSDNADSSYAFADQGCSMTFPGTPAPPAPPPPPPPPQQQQQQQQPQHLPPVVSRLADDQWLVRDLPEHQQNVLLDGPVLMQQDQIQQELLLQLRHQQPVAEREQHLQLQLPRPAEGHQTPVQQQQALEQQQQVLQQQPVLFLDQQQLETQEIEEQSVDTLVALETYSLTEQQQQQQQVCSPLLDCPPLKHEALSAVDQLPVLQQQQQQDRLLPQPLPSPVLHQQIEQPLKGQQQKHLVQQQALQQQQGPFPPTQSQQQMLLEQQQQQNSLLLPPPASRGLRPGTRRSPRPKKRANSEGLLQEMSGDDSWAEEKCLPSSKRQRQRRVRRGGRIVSPVSCSPPLGLEDDPNSSSSVFIPGGNTAQLPLSVPGSPMSSAACELLDLQQAEPPTSAAAPAATAAPATAGSSSGSRLEQQLTQSSLPRQLPELTNGSKCMRGAPRATVQQLYGHTYDLEALALQIDRQPIEEMDPGGIDRTYHHGKRYSVGDLGRKLLLIAVRERLAAGSCGQLKFLTLTDLFRLAHELGLWEFALKVAMAYKAGCLRIAKGLTSSPSHPRSLANCSSSSSSTAAPEQQ